MGRGLLNLFGAGHQVLYRVEVVGGGLAGVAIEEGVGAHHDRAVAVIHHAGDDSVVQGRRIQEGVETSNQWQQRAGCQAEAVKEGERIEEPLVIGDIQERVHLTNVGQKIGVGEHHTLGNAF